MKNVSTDDFIRYDFFDLEVAYEFYFGISKRIVSLSAKSRLLEIKMVKSCNKYLFVRMKDIKKLRG